ncbi:hypothetical protein CCYA_CCYA14G3802 [Cyanidiococcus yangmingshanensis]|nr:hypothetical protein CCYA_CCYA14G3802 [Cyanidiococcus yangmingshanensis]
MVQPAVPIPCFPPGVLPWLLTAGLVVLGIGSYDIMASASAEKSNACLRTLRHLASASCLGVLRSPEFVTLVFYSAIAAHIVESIAAFVFIQHNCRSRCCMEPKTFYWSIIVLIFGFPAFRELIKTVRSEQAACASSRKPRYAKR